MLDAVESPTWQTLYTGSKIALNARNILTKIPVNVNNVQPYLYDMTSPERIRRSNRRQNKPQFPNIANESFNIDTIQDRTSSWPLGLK